MRQGHHIKRVQRERERQTLQSAHSEQTLGWLLLELVCTARSQQRMRCALSQALRTHRRGGTAARVAMWARQMYSAQQEAP